MSADPARLLWVRIRLLFVGAAILSVVILLYSLLYVLDEWFDSRRQRISSSSLKSPSANPKPPRLSTSRRRLMVLRVMVLLCALLYQFWFPFTYYVPSRSIPRCSLFTRTEILLFTVVRSLVLLFFTLRFDLLSSDKRKKRIISFALFYNFLSFLAGALQVFDMVVFSVEHTDLCQYELGKVGISGYVIFFLLNLSTNYALFRGYLVVLKEYKAYAETKADLGGTARSKQLLSKKNKEIQDLNKAIFRSKAAFLFNALFTVVTDILYTFVYYIFPENLYSDSFTSQILVSLVDFTYIGSVFGGFISVLGTYGRFFEIISVWLSVKTWFTPSEGLQFDETIKPKAVQMNALKDSGKRLRADSKSFSVGSRKNSGVEVGKSFSIDSRKTSAADLIRPESDKTASSSDVHLSEPELKRAASEGTLDSFENKDDEDEVHPELHVNIETIAEEYGDGDEYRSPDDFDANVHTNLEMVGDESALGKVPASARLSDPAGSRARSYTARLLASPAHKPAPSRQFTSMY